MIDVSQIIWRDKIEGAYQDVATLLAFYVPTQLDYESAASALKSLVAMSKGDGTIDGKNAEMREGQAQTLYAANYTEVARLKQKADDAKLQLDLATIRKGEVNALLRLAEIIVQAESNDNNSG